MKRYIFYIFTLLLLVTSCKKDDPMLSGAGTMLTFSPMLEDVDMTKAIDSISSGIFELSDETNALSIPVTYYSTPNISDCFGGHPSDSAETKGQMITGNDLTTVGKFKVCAFYNDNGEEFVAPYQQVTLNDGIWTYTGDSKWLAKKSMIFFGYANETANISPDSQSKDGQSFKYTVPGNASDQTDFLVGWYSGTDEDCEKATGTKCKVPMSFCHPLTCVKFRQGSLETTVGDKEGKITNIKISGVVKTGDLTHEANGVISWNKDKETATVCQENSAGLSKDENGYIGDPFFLIPQNSGDITITVTICINDIESNVTKTMTPVWRAGYSYVYILNDQGCSAIIEDDSSVKNDSKAPEYFRAAVIAYDQTNGIITGPSSVPVVVNETDWTVGADGFYYYKAPVLPNQKSSGIVTNLADFKDTDSKLRVLVQASHMSLK